MKAIFIISFLSVEEDDDNNYGTIEAFDIITRLEY